jgi:hypothetical protein
MNGVLSPALFLTSSISAPLSKFFFKACAFIIVHIHPFLSHVPWRAAKGWPATTSAELKTTEQYPA